MSRTIRSKATKGTDSRNQRVQEIRLQEAKKAAREGLYEE